MKVEADLVLHFETEEEASNVLRSLKVDDGGYIESRLEGAKIIVHAEADSPGTLRETLDDYLSCMNSALGSCREVRGSLP